MQGFRKEIVAGVPQVSECGGPECPACLIGEAH